MLGYSRRNKLITRSADAALCLLLFCSCAKAAVIPLNNEEPENSESATSENFEASESFEKEPRNDNSETVWQSGGFLEIGLELFSDHTSLLTDRVDDGEQNINFDLDISAGYRYRRFFIEATRKSLGGANLGITLWQNPTWTVDFLAANINGHFETEDDENESETAQTDAQRERKLLNRNTFYAAAGARVSGYFGDRLVQFRLVQDYFDSAGILANARLGQQWQRGNWNLNGYVGVRYYSPDISNYWFGITAEEATERFPSYTAKQAFVPEAEVGASYPLTRDWVFATQFRVEHNPTTVAKSPLVDGKFDTHFSLGIKYVF